MSDVAEEAMDSSAVSDEEVDNQRETSQDYSSSNKSLPKIAGKEKEGDSFCSDEEHLRRALLFLGISNCRSCSVVAAVGEIVEGKRAKKTIERLDFQAPKQKEKLKVGDGNQTFKHDRNVSFQSHEDERCMFLCSQAVERN